jgi:hypothetical protein
MRMQRSFFVTLACLFAGTVMWAQVGRGGSEWLTAQGDAQRTSWIRTDGAISPDTMSKPGFELQWTSKLDNQNRQATGLFQGVTANGVTLFVPMSLVTGSSNNVYAMDNDTGYVVWTRHFDAALPAATPACAGGISASATRLLHIPSAPPAPPRGGGGGARGAGYRSLVGQPGEGVPVEPRAGGPGRAGAPPAAGAPARGGDPAAPPAPGQAGPARGDAQAGPGRGQQAPATDGIPGIPGTAGIAGGRGGLGQPGVVYVVASDGMLHVMGLVSGKDLQKPAPFLPANAQWSDAVAVNTTLYAATTGACGTPSGVWAIDLDSPAKPVTSWKTNGGSVVGNVAVTSTGTLVVAVGAGTAGANGYANAIVALDPKTLQVTDWYTQPSAEFVTGTMVVRHNDKDLVAAATKDGRILLLDATSLGGANHATPLAASASILGAGAKFAGAALASWQEGVTAGGAAAGAAPVPGAQWVLAPIAGKPGASAPATNGAITNGAVVALKLTDSGGTLSLQPGWTSHDLVSPGTPIIVNGVVFALATGRTAAGAGSPAVLHAYDGATGKSFWSSGKSMTSAAAERSFWAAMGQAYVGTNDGTVYAFGFLDERR